MNLFATEAMKALHQRLKLYIVGNESYIFVPVEPEAGQSLTISRNSGEIILNPPGAPLPRSAQPTETDIFGILGLVSLATSEYLILLTGRESQGQLMGQDIFRATDFKILPLETSSSSSIQHPVESHLLALVQSHLYGGTFFFSYGWDLTRRLQAQWAARSSDGGRALWEVADDRFFWNRFLHSRFIEMTKTDSQQDLSAFILPILYGSFDIRRGSLNGRSIRFGLISRRSRYRAGTRYFRRGIDGEGHVANFNETEQFLIFDDRRTVTGNEQLGTFGEAGTILSFVQIRGSVPLYWAEINTLRYKPDLQVMDLQGTVDAMRLHLQEQVRLYGDQSLVNLVNYKGHEMPVKDAYERYVAEANVANVKYEYFDFHNECKNMRWDRISVLIDRVKDDLKKYAYFHHDSRKPEPISLQTGTVRTNCMDNLDRTNVVQSALGKWTLNRQLRAVGIFSENETIDDHQSFLNDFRGAWANHGDSISNAYAGTGALKAGFTRTGKRTFAGKLDDGYKSIVRYVKNNYFDGARQDAFDIVTGAWLPRIGPYTALSLVTDNRPLLIRSVPYTAGYSLFMILAGLTLPRTSDYSLFYYFVFWYTLLISSLIFIFAHGLEYVAWPRLNPPTDAIYYDGPGVRSGNHGKGFGGGGSAKHGVAGKIQVGKTARWLSSGRRRSHSNVTEIELGTRKRVD